MKTNITEKKPLNFKLIKVALDVIKKPNGNKNIIVRPDPDQSAENKISSRKWINNIFLKESPYKSGIMSYTLDDWKKPDGGMKKFIDAVKKSPDQVTWLDKSEDKLIMKGLMSYLPNMVQSPVGNFGMPGAMGGMGGGPGGGMPGLGGMMGGGMNKPIGFGGGGLPPGAGLKGLNPNLGQNPASGTPVKKESISFYEYLERIDEYKHIRKSGPLRRDRPYIINHNLAIPPTGNEKVDRERRYKNKNFKIID